MALHLHARSLEFDPVHNVNLAFAHTGNPSTLEGEAGGEVQGHSQLPG